MGLFDNFLSLLSSKIDLERDTKCCAKRLSGTMSSFYKARDRKTGEIVGLKILDPEKVNIVESRFKELDKPSEAEIGQSSATLTSSKRSGTELDRRPAIHRAGISGRARLEFAVDEPQHGH